MIIIKLIATICVCTVLVISDIKASHNDNNVEVIPVQLEETAKDTARILDENGSLKTIDVQKLFNLYADNFYDNDFIKKLDSEQVGSYLKITGTADMICNNYIDGCYIVMTQHRNKKIYDGFTSYWFFFSDTDEKDKVMQLKEGDKVTIVGYCNEGKNLVNCYLR